MALFILSFILILFYITKVFKRKMQEKNARCTYSVNAICVDRYEETKWDRHTDINGNRKYISNYYTFWEFMYNGQRYRVKTACLPRTYAEIGESSTLLINPENPYDFIKEETIFDKRREEEESRLGIYVTLGVVLVLLIGLILPRVFG